MAIKSEITADIMLKTGQDLLPEEIAENFKNARSAVHIRVLKRTLSEYTWAEWLICLKEKVLLEQCLPYVSEKLDDDPLIPGLFSKGEVLYDVTRIDDDFWMSHQDWLEYFRTIINTVLDKLENDSDTKGIIREYVEAYRSFVDSPINTTGRD
ncbi:MAG: hypothetical protein J6I66_03585 [Lachnospiraceae bacterium]|nr:hypothetical protein [Lachnospiraceae bacterium]